MTGDRYETATFSGRPIRPSSGVVPPVHAFTGIVG